MKRIYIIEFLKREQKFLLAGMRMQKDEGGGRILLGDGTSGTRCHGTMEFVLQQDSQLTVCSQLRLT